MTTPSKRDLRHAARARRRELARRMDAAAPGLIADAVLRFVPDPGRVAVYESLPDEPPTGRLVEALLAAGHEVIVPVVLDDFTLEWRYAVPGTEGDDATVRRPSHGGHEPDPDERDGWLGTDALATCDLVVTPGLAGRPPRHTPRAGRRLLRPRPAPSRPLRAGRHAAARG